METLESFKDFMDPNPVLSHRFGVTFFAGGLIPNPIDFRFQKVRGINTEVQLETISEGGQNLHRYHLPNQINYNNLTLERGVVSPIVSRVSPTELLSPLNLEFNNTFSRFQFTPSNVLITLFKNDQGIPAASWLFFKAYPVKWSVSDLDATSNSVLIDTMELAYSRFQSIRL